MSDEAQGPQGPEPGEVDLTGETPVPGQVRDVDLTKLEPLSGAGLPQAPPTIPVQRERLRGRIALLLIALLIAMVLISFVMLWFLPTSRFDSLMRLLQIIFAPIIGLVGAVTGFYYGGGGSRFDNSAESALNE
jgi:hypothetical protein